MSRLVFRSLLQLSVTLLLVDAIEGVALETHTSSQAPTTSSPTRTSLARISDFHLRATETIPTSASYSPALLYLNVTTLTPDPLGIANVSGVYGQGAWAAWFLTGTAAWWKIIKQSEDKVDSNTWVFLFGINWTAVDIFKTIHNLQSLSSAEEEAKFSLHIGTFGAGFNVLFWGSFHALLQLHVTFTLFENSGSRRHRMRTMIVGLVLPLIALLATTCLFHRLPNGDMAFRLLPALYAMVEKDVVIDDLMKRKILSKIMTVYVYISCAALLIVVFVFIAGMKSKNWFWLAFRPLFSRSAFVLPWFIPFLLAAFIGICGGYYVWDGYLRRNSESWITESCYFMPCSPQSIKDEDQPYALLAGVFLFVGFEAAPPLFKYLQRRYRENRRFVQMVEGALRQFEMRRIGPPRQEAGEG
ncbi:hypothetical protein BDZ45DRAFT_699692 [Acephala macrosclerotiorum]|nr:hypothetical protein BDZ45DRAFT_699692 [Acephala macrosclerotiorum]